MAKKYKKVKRYHHNYYDSRQRLGQVVSVVVLVVVVLVAAWFAAPHILDWLTHTWYTVVKKRDLSPSSVSVAVQEEETEAESPVTGEETSEETSSDTAQEEERTTEEQATDPTQVKEGLWATVSLSALDKETSIRATAKELKAEGIRYALVTMKDSSGYFYYASELPYAQGGVAATLVDASKVTEIFEEEGLVPVAAVSAFRDPISPYQERSLAIHYKQTTSLWLDASSKQGGKPWLDPYAENAVQFVGDVVEELYDLGFRQVVLTYVQFPSYVSENQTFSRTGGRSRSQQLGRDIATWNARFAGKVTLWYEYALSECREKSTALDALPPELGVKNLMIRIPTDDKTDAEALAAVEQTMKDGGVAYVVAREGTRAKFF